MGDPDRLAAALGRDDVAAEIVKPLYIVPQLRNLLENSWEAFRRVLSGDPGQGRDPEEADLDRFVLYVSGDLPFATPQEISVFIERTLAADCDYGCGLVTAQSLEAFRPAAPGEPGIEVAYFHLREAKLRQNNLHLVRPASLAHREHIEDVYEHRAQLRVWNMISLAFRMILTGRVGPMTMRLYSIMHLASVADRRGWVGVSNWLRRFVPMPKVELAVSRLLGTRFRFITTDVGGCAMDIDKEEEYDAARTRWDEWSKAQTARAEALHGPLPLPPSEQREAQ
ncbi:MAG: hypothetical protein O7A09_02545 [Proteobacteria bacterium]|nr:hypothetical protein [Pseudomonadota bacterium]